MGHLDQRRIILAVSGGIAAYKACELASRLAQDGATVTPVLTRGAQKFVTPLTFEALTGRPCLTRIFQRAKTGATPFPHIHAAQDAELVVIAPATANLIARLAHGFASDLLSTLLLTVRCPVLVCPAMNVLMWEHAATRANVKALEKLGCKILGPGSGSLACGMEGKGRMAEPDEIFDAVRKILTKA